MTHSPDRHTPRRTARTVVALVLATATVGGSFAIAGGTAQAASTPAVTSPGCGRITVNPKTYTGSGKVQVYFDGGFTDGPYAAGGSASTETGLPGGKYSYVVENASTGDAVGGGVVSVATCAGGRTRTVEGDANGDKLADVFGVTRSGSLIYYRMTKTGLQNVKVSFASGFSTTKFIQRVTEVAAPGAVGVDSGVNYLFAIRTDGTLWRYKDSGNGTIGAGVQIGSGLGSYSNFMITQNNSPYAFGDHALVATDNSGNLVMFTGLGASKIGAAQRVDTGWTGLSREMSLSAYDANGFADVVTIWDGSDMYADKGSWNGFTDAGQIGHGWGAMQVVTSPGDVNGDGLSDLVARRADGNLYRYLNVGGRWGAAEQIGKNWGGIVALG